MQDAIQFEHLAGFLNRWPWLGTEVYNNTVGEYFAVLGTVFCVWLISTGLTLILEKHGKRITDRTESKIDDNLIELIHRSITFILVLTTIYFGVQSLDLPASIDQFMAKGLFILFTLKIAWELDRFSTFFLKIYLQPYARKQRGLIKTVIAPLSRVSRFIIWTLALLLIIGNLGYNISSLLAGLGVGGLAIALAAQETLGNALGSLSIITDQPFVVGDYIEAEGVSGTVKEVGLRSTRIETLDRNIVTIPNKVMAAATIQNYSKRKEFNVDLKLGIDFNTPASEIKHLMKALERVLRKDPAVVNETFRVNVTDFGDYAIELSVFYYINDVSTYARSLELRERVNLKLKETVEKTGINIPYPTQSLRIENAKDFMPVTRRKKTH